MGELTDKIKGNINEAIGKGKQAVPNKTDSASFNAEGKAKKTKGKSQQTCKARGALGN